MLYMSLILSIRMVGISEKQLKAILFSLPAELEMSGSGELLFPDDLRTKSPDTCLHLDGGARLS